MTNYNESYWRTLSKVVSMRVMFTCIHIMNTFIVTGSLMAGVKVAGLAFFVNPVLIGYMNEDGISGSGVGLVMTDANLKKVIGEV